MRRIAFFLIFVFASVASFAGGKDAYLIKVKLNGLKDTVCYLGNHFGDKQYIRDTARIDSKGNAVFKGNKKLDGGIYLIITPSKKYFEIIVNDDQDFGVETDTLEFIKNAKITGSEENKLFFEYLNFVSKKHTEVTPFRALYEKNKGNDSAKFYLDKINAIDKEVKDYKINHQNKYPQHVITAIFKATKEIDIPETPKLANGRSDSTFAYRYYKAHFFDNIDFSDDRLLRTPIFHQKLEQYMKNMILQMPDSINKEADMIIAKAKKGNKEIFKYCVWYITNTYETSNIMGMDAVFVHMAENYYTYEQAFWVDSTQIFKIRDRARILKPLLIGKVAPNLTMFDDLGKVQSLHAQKSPYTILLFWDPDCGHCKKSMPFVKEAYDKLKTKGVGVFAVCTEVELDKWKKYIEENKLDWVNVADAEFRTNFRAIYDITSTPQIYILNSKKEIIAKKIGAEQLEEFMERELKKNN